MDYGWSMMRSDSRLKAEGRQKSQNWKGFVVNMSLGIMILYPKSSRTESDALNNALSEVVAAGRSAMCMSLLQLGISIFNKDACKCQVLASGQPRRALRTQ